MPTDPTDPSRRARVKATLLLLITFLAGFVGGVVGDRLSLLHQKRMLPPHGGHVVTPRIVKHLTRELDLRPEQQRGIAQIVERKRLTIEAISAAVHPKILQEIELGHGEIEQLLDAGQKVRFKALQRKWEHRLKRFAGPPPVG